MSTKLGRILELWHFTRDSRRDRLPWWICFAEVDSQCSQTKLACVKKILTLLSPFYLNLINTFLKDLESRDFHGSSIVYMPFKGLFFNCPTETSRVWGSFPKSGTGAISLFKRHEKSQISIGVRRNLSHLWSISVWREKIISQNLCSATKLWHAGVFLSVLRSWIQFPFPISVFCSLISPVISFSQGWFSHSAKSHQFIHSSQF